MRRSIRPLGSRSWTGESLNYCLVYHVRLRNPCQVQAVTGSCLFWQFSMVTSSLYPSHHAGSRVGVLMAPAIHLDSESEQPSGCNLCNHRDGYHLGSCTLTWLYLTGLDLQSSIHFLPCISIFHFPCSHVLASVSTSCSLSYTSLLCHPSHQTITQKLLSEFVLALTTLQKEILNICKSCWMFVLLPVPSTLPYFFTYPRQHHQYWQ